LTNNLDLFSHLTAAVRWLKAWTHTEDTWYPMICQCTTHWR